MTRLYCPDCSEYLEGGDGECHDCSCGWKQPVETFEDDNTTLQVAYNELCEELEDSQRKLEVAAEFCRQYQIENAQLKEKLQIRDNQLASKKAVIEELEKEKDHLQFLLDSVMLEYCPDEMTEEQIENWSKHQKKSNLETKL